MASPHQLPAALDHVIVLLPYKELQEPPKWLADNFTITPGGKHADGKTENKLIVFPDGTYIELIAFIDDKPENRAGHWWGNKPFGIIDWALTSRHLPNTQRASLNLKLAGVQLSVRPPPGHDGALSYAPPKTGGRTNADGTELKWAVTFPIASSETGETRPAHLPFFCHDITPRQLRVPAARAHPCGAVGIKELRALVGPGGYGAYPHSISVVANTLPEYVTRFRMRIPLITPSVGVSGIIITYAGLEEDREALKESEFLLQEIAFNFMDDSEGITFRYP
ncbi:hypothetical protein DRE_03475 [Drechslerella stenobrocha 248]|uniref:Glyoxalase-like domain-containing protein n=1 Tax=Drechslerella stenobrocha 248 TaxID=1043628 RepID=W7HSR9_9PEZI|nr:hypothetical protein DRE_03475 [Drechslerella stenobrocha 248]